MADDAKRLINMGFAYDGVELSCEASSFAIERLKRYRAHLIIGDFFKWSPTKPYAAIYDKGVFHGLRRNLRLRFVRRVAEALVEKGIWVTVCGSAETAESLRPQARHGAIRLFHLVEAVEPYFEILNLEKANYGLRDPKFEFEAWYGLFRRRESGRQKI